MSDDAANGSAPPQVSVQLSDAARAKIQEVIAAQPVTIEGARVTLAGRGPQGFEHGFALVAEGGADPEDAIVDAGPFLLFVEGRNLEYLDGLAIDFVPNESGVGGRFVFENPNPLWRDELALRIQSLFDQMINPQIAAHGGMVNLVAVEETRAYVALGGGCQGCNLANVTLKQGIEVAVLEYIPEITEVIDVTDHASGTNPYYRPSKK